MRYILKIICINVIDVKYVCFSKLVSLVDIVVFNLYDSIID